VERLPKTGAFVIIANHSSHLDLFVLLASLPWRRRGCATAVSAGDTFFSGPVRAWASAHMLNVLPLWRRGATGGALSDFRARLCGREEILVIFPEGTRSRTGAMAGFKPGLGRLVAGTSVPVVPCFIEGAHAALPPGKRLPALRPLRVKIGVAIDFAHCEDGKTAWLEIAATCENAVRQLMK